MKSALLTYIGRLEVDKAEFLSLVDVLGKIVRISFSLTKSALLTYIGRLEVDKAAFPSLADVLGKNRYDKFFFSETGFINIHRPSRS